MRLVLVILIYGNRLLTQSLKFLNKKNIPEEKNFLRNSRKGLGDNRNNNPAKINKNNKFSNLTVQKLDQNKSDYTNKNYIVLEDNKRKIIQYAIIFTDAIK